jgi:hypothetical protein
LLRRLRLCVFSLVLGPADEIYMQLALLAAAVVRILQIFTYMSPGSA